DNESEPQGRLHLARLRRPPSSRHDHRRLSAEGRFYCLALEPPEHRLAHHSEDLVHGPPHLADQELVDVDQWCVDSLGHQAADGRLTGARKPDEYQMAGSHLSAASRRTAQRVPSAETYPS